MKFFQQFQIEKQPTALDWLDFFDNCFAKYQKLDKMFGLNAADFGFA